MNNLNKPQLDYGDVLIVPRVSTIDSRKDVSINKVYKFKWGAKPIEGCGVMAANMATTGTFEMAKALQKHQMFCALSKHYSYEDIIGFLEENKSKFGTNDYVFVSTGLRNNDFEKLVKVMKTGLCNNICLDAPNGYIPLFKSQLQKIRHYFPKSVIMAGNVVTPSISIDIIRCGADIVKEGIGPGANCRTRTQTGVGFPQLSTIMENVEWVKHNGGMICADGGISVVGDICKAFGAGSDFVMIGGMFAGSDESASEIITKHFKTNEVDDNGKDIIIDKKFKLQYGMASNYAQEKHYGGRADYRANEGLVSLVPYTGPVENIIREIEGGLRSSMTFTDSHNLSEFQRKVSFCRVNRQVYRNQNAIERE